MLRSYILIASCYWENVDVTVANVRTITNIYNAYDCQSTCAAASDCFYFVYDKTVFYCYHKVNAFGAGYNSKFTSGPKVCPDSEFNFQDHIKLSG